jgi:hypothetical protein
MSPLAAWLTIADISEFRDSNEVSFKFIPDSVTTVTAVSKTDATSSPILDSKPQVEG